MPTMVFSMLDALSVEPGNRVLEIGTGTGWNAALLCHRLGDQNVVSVELDATLAAEARSRLYAADFAPEIVVGDGAVGHGKRSPYDRIIATASVGHVPPSGSDRRIQERSSSPLGDRCTEAKRSPA
ncbi:methyltransferase domain-containing protein [Streptomyces sp. C8S0]|uniref:methyltransferase domain-containing protein n=1 Tax=Streptomyces sp. C8S0 TaxID=2585716 RepID=UPI00299F5F41|nr:methyltransferase domain-containing protein [Streptomyces sp. C8S0]